MAVADALRTFLLADSDVSTLVGTRIHRGTAPQTSTQPYITYRLLGKDSTHASGGAQPVVVYYFEVNCWAKTYAEATALYDEVRKAIDGYRGELDTGDFAHRCFMGDVEDIEASPRDGDQQGHRGVSADLEIAYTETVTEF